MQVSKYIRFLVFLLICVSYFLIINERPDFTRFNAHDSGSYLALSYNIVNGNGYTRNIADGDYIPHTLWPPGMAVLLIPSIIISGDIINWLAVKSTIILIGLLGIVLARMYTKRITGNNNAADIAALTIALNPYYWHFSHIVLAEVPLITWIFGALLLIDYFWTKPVLKYYEAIVIGFIVGLGMMIKGSVLGLIIAPLGYFFAIWTQKKSLKKYFIIYVIYSIAFCIPFVLWSIRNSGIDTTGLGLDGVNQVQMILKEVPENPESRYRTLSEIMDTIKENVFWYGIYRLPDQVIPFVRSLELESVEGAGKIISLLLTLLILILVFPLRLNTLPLLFTMIPMILLILPLSIGGSSRYWFPLSIFAIILIIDKIYLLFHYLIPQISDNRKVLKPLSVIVLSGLLSLNLLFYIFEFQNNPYSKKDYLKELAQLYEKNAQYCIGLTSTSGIDVYTRNPYTFKMITGCNASMKNLTLNINPEYTHAILNENQLRFQPDDQNVISKESPWLFIKLDESFTAAEIKKKYY